MLLVTHVLRTSWTSPFANRSKLRLTCLLFSSRYLVTRVRYAIQSDEEQNTKTEQNEMVFSSDHACLVLEVIQARRVHINIHMSAKCRWDIVTVAFHALFHLLSTLICNTNIITWHRLLEDSRRRCNCSSRLITSRAFAFHVQTNKHTKQTRNTSVHSLIFFISFK